MLGQELATKAGQLQLQSDSYTYSSDGRLRTWNGGPTYTFDLAGNLTGDTGRGTTFTYDGANRLTQSVSGGATTVYGWDQGNAWRTSQGPSGNPTQIQYTYTRSGTSTSNGRMTRYQNGATSTDATYSYDASEQRTKSVVTVGSTTTTTDFVYDGRDLLGLSASQGEATWRIDYLCDEEGHPYGAIYRSPADSTSPTAFTMITNDHGDVLELLDGQGNAFVAYRYDPWGLPSGSGNYATGIWTQGTSLVTSTLAGQIASRQVLRYAGYAWDGESGLYYCSARYYDANTRQSRRRPHCPDGWFVRRAGVGSRVTTWLRRGTGGHGRSARWPAVTCGTARWGSVLHRQ
jgi:hypothetical protein